MKQIVILSIFVLGSLAQAQVDFAAESKLTDKAQSAINGYIQSHCSIESTKEILTTLVYQDEVDSNKANLYFNTKMSATDSQGQSFQIELQTIDWSGNNLSEFIQVSTSPVGFCK